LSQWWAKFSGRAKQRRGGNFSPYDGIWGKIQIGAPELCFFKGRVGYLLLVSSYWGSTVRLRELILMLENLIK
jgi:hypothetical protein